MFFLFSRARAALVLGAVGLCLWLTPTASAQTLLWSGKANPLQRAAYGVAFSANGQQILSGSECHLARIRVWDASTGAITWDYLIDTTLYCLSGVKFSTNGQSFGTIEELGRLIIFDNSVSPPVQTHQVAIGAAGAYSLAFAPDNQRLAVDGSDRRIRIFDIASGAVLRTLTGHTGAVVSVDWAPDGSKLASGARDRTARLWDGTSGNPLHTFSLTENAVGVKWRADNSQLVVAQANGIVRIYDATTSAQVNTLTVPEAIYQVDLSDDGRYLAVGTATTTRIYDLGASGNPQVASFNLPNGGIVYSVDFRPNSPEVVIGNGNGDVALYSLRTVLATAAESAGAVPVRVFPVPATDWLTVGGAPAFARYSLLDLAGRPVRTGALTSKGQLSVADIQAGQYLLTLEAAPFRPLRVVVQ